MVYSTVNSLYVARDYVNSLYIARDYVNSLYIARDYVHVILYKECVNVLCMYSRHVHNWYRLP